VAELLRAARIAPDYSALDEAAKRTLLTGLLNDARALRVRGTAYSEHAQSELAIFEMARQWTRDTLVVAYMSSNYEDTVNF
jgi:phosphoenolpyruvate carboxylase